MSEVAQKALMQWFDQNRERLETAAMIVAELQEWIESHEGLPPDSIPLASVTYFVYGMQISIDDICLWDSEEDDSGSLSKEACICAYLENLRSRASLL